MYYNNVLAKRNPYLEQNDPLQQLQVQESLAPAQTHNVISPVSETPNLSSTVNPLAQPVQNFKLPEPEESEAEKNWRGTPGLGKIPLNDFVTIAGMAANALAPDSFGGRFGGLLAGYAQKKEDNKLNDLYKRASIAEVYDKLDPSGTQNALRKLQINEARQKMMNEFSSNMKDRLATLDPVRDPEGYNTAIGELEAQAKEHGMSIRLPQLWDFIKTNEKGETSFDEEGFNQAKLTAMSDAKSVIKHAYENKGSELKLYKDPHGNTHHVAVSKSGEAPKVWDAVTGKTSTMPSDWTPVEKVESMNWQTALSMSYQAKTPEEQARWKKISDALWVREFTMKATTKSEPKVEYGYFFDPINSKKVMLTKEEGMSRSWDTDPKIPSATQLAGLKSAALTGKIGKNAVDPVSYAEQYNKYAPGTMTNILRPVTVADTTLGIKGDNYTIIKEIKLPKFHGVQMTMAHVRRALDKDKSLRLDDVLRHIGAIE